MIFTIGWMKLRAVCLVKRQAKYLHLFTNQMTDGVPKNVIAGENSAPEEVTDPPFRDLSEFLDQIAFIERQ